MSKLLLCLLLLGMGLVYHGCQGGGSGNGTGTVAVVAGGAEGDITPFNTIGVKMDANVSITVAANIGINCGQYGVDPSCVMPGLKFNVYKVADDLNKAVSLSGTFKIASTIEKSTVTFIPTNDFVAGKVYEVDIEYEDFGDSSDPDDDFTFYYKWVFSSTTAVSCIPRDNESGVYLSSASMTKAIYGPDDRYEISETSLEIRTLAKSTAAMIGMASMTLSGDGDSYAIPDQTLGTRMNMCPDQAFVDMNAIASCSGFLLADDILVTAGHCVTDIDSCHSNYWVFDYTDDEASDLSIPSENVYKCSMIVSRALNSSSLMDYAVILLDRPVSGNRKPLQFRRTGAVGFDDLFIIGHPSGMVSIFADNAEVKELSDTVYFKTNLDAFGGNSGSAVFNQTSGEVEGILVRGANDYLGGLGACTTVAEYADNTGNEAVTRITGINLDQVYCDEIE